MNPTPSDAVVDYRRPATGSQADELMEGETKLGLKIQLSLIGVMIVAMIVIVAVDRFLH